MTNKETVMNTQTIKNDTFLYATESVAFFFFETLNLFAFSKIMAVKEKEHFSEVVIQGYHSTIELNPTLHARFEQITRKI